MRRRVLLAESASLDVVDILEHVAATRGLELALEVNQRLERALESLEQLAGRGRVVPELRARGVSAYRERLELPYRIVYRIIADEVRVVAVVDHRRDLDALLHARARRS
jgi:plasmid stabilization system protein ParE